MKKRVFSLLLALVMCVQFGTSAFATEPVEDAATTKEITPVQNMVTVKTDAAMTAADHSSYSVFSDGVKEERYSGSYGYVEKGNYYLTEDYTLPSDLAHLQFNGTVNLCLHGHTLDLGTKGIYLNWAELNIYDCTDTAHNGTTGGKITSSNGYYGYTISLYCSDLTLNGGTIENNRTDFGSAIYGVGTSDRWSNITINGGCVKGLRAVEISAYSAVSVNGGTLSGDTFSLYTGGSSSVSPNDIIVTGGTFIKPIYLNCYSNLFLSGTPAFDSGNKADIQFGDAAYSKSNALYATAGTETDSAKYTGEPLRISADYRADGDILVYNTVDTGLFVPYGSGPALQPKDGNLVLHIHSGTLTEAKDATCTEDGNRACYTCTCGKYFSDSGCTQEIAQDSWVIPAKGSHTYDRQSTDEKYLIAKAATVDATVYYYSCECGEKGTETFTVSESSAVTAGGACGESVYWCVTTDGKLIIYGTGPMQFTGYSAPWAEYKQQIITAKVEYGVTSIAGHAFQSCTNMISADIAKSVVSIGEYAFYDCSSLTSVTLWEGVASIGHGAFADCTSLLTIVIPKSVTKLEGSTFIECFALKSVVLPKGLVTIGDSAFESCTALTDVYYLNTAEQWDKVTVGGTNGLLTGATLHPLGDAYADGTIDVLDQQAVYSHINGNAPIVGYAALVADVNGDGKINVIDQQIIYMRCTSINFT